MNNVEGMIRLADDLIQELVVVSVSKAYVFDSNKLMGEFLEGKLSSSSLIGRYVANGLSLEQLGEELTTLRQGLEMGSRVAKAKKGETL